MLDPDERHSEQLSANLDALLEEENHYTRLKAVFGTEDGLRVLGWLLDTGGYWRAHIQDARDIGKFEFSRFIFDQVCIADVGICHSVLTDRRERAERNRMAEKKKIEDEIKQQSAL